MPDDMHVIDPVCGMTITVSQAPFAREHGGSMYYLCSVECRLKFEVDSEAYAAAARIELPGWGLTPHPESVIEQFRRPENPL
jgi:YHS domain-containing protein